MKKKIPIRIRGRYKYRKLHMFCRLLAGPENNYYVTKSDKISPRWTAPEVLATLRHWLKSDVWSFGKQICYYYNFFLNVKYLAWDNFMQKLDHAIFLHIIKLSLFLSIIRRLTKIAPTRMPFSQRPSCLQRKVKHLQFDLEMTLTLR